MLEGKPACKKILGSSLRNFIDQNELEIRQTIRNHVNEINVVNSK